MRFAGPAIQAHLVQASTNLVDCEMLGQVVDRGGAWFEFQDASAARFPCRSYLIVSP